MQNKYNINHTNQKFVEFCSSCERLSELREGSYK